jgi:hypothetical protein
LKIAKTQTTFSDRYSSPAQGKAADDEHPDRSNNTTKSDETSPHVEEKQ